MLAEGIPVYIYLTLNLIQRNRERTSIQVGEVNGALPSASSDSHWRLRYENGTWFSSHNFK